jgi:hypothetical protein
MNNPGLKEPAMRRLAPSPQYHMSAEGQDIEDR